jgi:hypothetical protein
MREQLREMIIAVKQMVDVRNQQLHLKMNDMLVEVIAKRSKGATNASGTTKERKVI